MWAVPHYLLCLDVCRDDTPWIQWRLGNKSSQRLMLGIERKEASRDAKQR